MEIFVTPVLITLPVYIALLCKQCIIQEKQVFVFYFFQYWTCDPLFSRFCVLSFHTVLLTLFFTKRWWLFFHVVCYFAEVLQMNDLLNREHFSHALTYCVCVWRNMQLF